MLVLRTTRPTTSTVGYRLKKKRDAHHRSRSSYYYYTLTTARAQATSDPVSAQLQTTDDAKGRGVSVSLILRKSDASTSACYPRMGDTRAPRALI